MATRAEIDCVAEYVMGLARPCQCVVATRDEYGNYRCDNCGAKMEQVGSCKGHPFPSFTLIDLMRELAEQGVTITVRSNMPREEPRFRIKGMGLTCNTNDPFGALCVWLTHGERFGIGQYNGRQREGQ